MDFPLKSYKKEFEHSYTFGVFATLELLAHRPECAARVLTASKGQKNAGVAKIWEVCAGLGVPVEVNDKAVERLAPRENAYAVGVFRKHDAPPDPARDHIVLVNPADMGNLGTIARTMAGFGVTDLAMIRPAADLFDPRAIRASMGAIFQLGFAYYDDFSDYRATFSHHLYPFMTDAERAVSEVTFEPPFALVFGSESAGLPEEFGQIGTPVAIPHSAGIDSLNLAVAVGIGLYASAGKRSFRE